MKTKITELLQIEYPVFQGGMAWKTGYSIFSSSVIFVFIVFLILLVILRYITYSDDTRVKSP